MRNLEKATSSIRILDNRVDMIGISDLVEIMNGWIETEPDQVHHVVNTGMHGLIEAHRDKSFAAILERAEILAPDGILAVILSRLHGYNIKKQDTGPDLLRRFSVIASQRNYRYFFLGDTAETLNLLSSKLSSEFPGLQIVGYNSPPFRPLTQKENFEIVCEINRARPDVLWVGFGMPKQERWISDHRGDLKVPVIVGAGAAFKFTSGQMRRAPNLVCTMGFEWLWRLVQEPHRIWRRVLVDAPQFIILVCLQKSGIKKYK